MDKKDILREPIEHIDIKAFDSTRIIDSMRGMSFTARDTARAADILNKMIEDKDCTIMLCIAGSTSAGGCMQVYVDLVRHNM
ncbi:MAG: deoxyhypusine synthase, partial [Planctomycetaceae bacterium]